METHRLEIVGSYKNTEKCISFNIFNQIVASLIHHEIWWKIMLLYHGFFFFLFIVLLIYHPLTK